MLRPTLSEDCVQYVLYPDCSTLEQLAAARDAAWAWLQTHVPLLGTYIWQRDAFELAVVPGVWPLQLTGAVRFGDHLGDEWFVVWLLRSLSARFPTWPVSVTDDDGEFLLIEAARELPEWLEPDVSEHRVWLLGGSLRLLPPDAAPSPLALVDALALLRSRGADFLASERVRAAVDARLAGFPGEAERANHHHFTVAVPRPVALALRARPALVARAVTHFYYRSPDELRHLRPLRRLDPLRHQPVMCRVRFTRCLYAQLLQQSFTPPSGQFVLPPEADAGPHKRASLGMKLCCGFELWMALVDGAAREFEEAVAVGEAVADDVAGDCDDDGDEGWMLVSPEEVNDLMAARESEVQAELSASVGAVKSFMVHKSSVDGVEMPDRVDSDPELDDAPTNDAMDAFDVDLFMEALRGGLGAGAGARNEQHHPDAIAAAMDRELGQHGLDADFERDPEGAVDADLTLVANMLRGMEAAQGGANPMAALLAQLKEETRNK